MIPLWQSVIQEGSTFVIRSWVARKVGTQRFNRLLTMNAYWQYDGSSCVYDDGRGFNIGDFEGIPTEIGLMTDLTSIYGKKCWYFPYCLPTELGKLTALTSLPFHKDSGFLVRYRQS